MSAVSRWSTFSAIFLGLARIVFGFLFACHGAQKVLGWFGGMPPGVPPFIKYGAGGIELVGGLLIMVGLFTRFAAFIASGEMAVAYFMGHASHAQGINFFLPTVNKGEDAVLYCFFFLFLSAAGAGALALDRMTGSRRAP